MSEIPIVKKTVRHIFANVFVSANWLLKKPVWVCYHKKGHNIINPANEEPAYNDDPDTWGSFSAACEYIDNHKEYTLALQLSRDSGLSAVHVGNCVNSDGTITSDQQINELIHYCSSYAEYDVSGKGLTFLLSGNDILPYKAYTKKIGDIEISLYDYYQCIPLTGNLFDRSDKEEIEQMGLGYDPNITPYAMTRCPEFIKLIYKWMAGTFSGTEKQDLDNDIPLEIMEIKGLGEIAKCRLNDLIKNNQYFQYLWYNNIPTDKGERHHDIDLVARIYSVVSYSTRTITDIFKASPSFKAKSREIQFKFEDVIKIRHPKIAKLAGNQTNTYKDISPVMKNLVETAEKLNQDRDFMKFDNDIELMKDKIYGDIIDLSNDKACSDIFLAAYGKRIKYCSEDNLWYFFNGSYWVRESNNALPHIRAFGEKLFERLNDVLNWYNMEYKENRKMQRNINKFANVMPFKRILESARSKSLISSDSFNSKAQKLSVGNGTIDLKTGKLERHDPSDYFTFHTNVDYFTNYAPPRKFIKFLKDVFLNDEELIAYFQRVMGYCITGDTDAQVCFVFHGKGGNGKSTLINILNGVLNDYAGQFDSFALALKNDGDGRPNPLLIENQSKRYVVVSEKNEGTKLDEALIKAISGGDSISARRLFENYKKPFKPTYKLIFVMNSLPNISWNDDAIKRRYRIIPFNRKFERNEIDPKLAEKILAEEKEMILKWLIDGAKDYYNNQCSLGKTPKAMKDAMTKARNESKNEKDILYTYQKERLIVTQEETDRVQSRFLYSDYERWCEEKGYKKITETAFGNKMPGILNVEKEKRRNVYYLGLKFKESNEK